MYSVRVNEFEGPMDLLLHLIYKNEMDISAISVSAIADEYLQQLEAMQDAQLDISGEFFVMAATLAVIKSKSLLPGQEGPGEDPREELVHKLQEYRRYKELSGELAECETAAADLHPRGRTPDVTHVDAADAHLDADLYDLLQAYQQVVAQYQTRQRHQVKISTINLIDQMERLCDYLANAGGHSDFAGIAGWCRSRLEIVVSFIALLELARDGRIQLHSHPEGPRICLSSTLKTSQSA